MKTSRGSSSQFRFASCELDAATRTLTRFGSVVEIEPVIVRGRGFRFVPPLHVGWDDPIAPVDGEPRIGKSRLVQGIVERARGIDVETLVARWVDGDDSSAFWPRRQRTT